MFGKKFKGKIYKITYPKSSYYYYGQTVIPLKQRLRDHINSALRGSTTDLSAWIKRLPDPHRLKIKLMMRAKSSDHLNDLEEKIIGDLWKTDLFCLNMIPGGKGGVPTGEKNGNSVLTQDLADQIKIDWTKNNFDINALVTKYSASNTTIRRVLTGKTFNPEGHGSLMGDRPRRFYPDKKPKSTKPRKSDEWMQRAQDIRVFASKHQDWTGADVGREFNANTRNELKYIRKILRNDACCEDNWDPDTWTYTS